MFSGNLEMCVIEILYLKISLKIMDGRKVGLRSWEMAAARVAALFFILKECLFHTDGISQWEKKRDPGA